ncbi:MAG: hypothetical protein GX662_12605 [Trichococcus flocculiformis]|uniref:Uncharacterized protein n=1 Tax=Trichococcus flocculiformis TaxID=82803 RepID=A0A847D885_9LACT|nr:hypothetical protein [Trichococcus flocculiformis]NLD33073.1 hypothetical protein [Trichococcus flocculiformis]
MKYIEIPFDRVVVLCRQGETSRVFVRRSNGGLDQADAHFYSLNTIVNELQYFEQVEEVDK